MYSLRDVKLDFINVIEIHPRFPFLLVCRQIGEKKKKKKGQRNSLGQGSEIIPNKPRANIGVGR